MSGMESWPGARSVDQPRVRDEYGHRVDDSGRCAQTSCPLYSGKEALEVSGQVEPPPGRPSHVEKASLLIEAESFVSDPAAWTGGRRRSLLRRLQDAIGRERRYLGLPVLVLLLLCGSSVRAEDAEDCLCLGCQRPQRVEIVLPKTPKTPSTLQLVLVNTTLDTADLITTDMFLTGRISKDGVGYGYFKGDRNPLVNAMPNRAARIVLFEGFSAAATLGMKKLRDSGHPKWAWAVHIVYAGIRINSLKHNFRSIHRIDEAVDQRNRELLFLKAQTQLKGVAQ